MGRRKEYFLRHLLTDRKLTSCWHASGKDDIDKWIKMVNFKLRKRKKEMIDHDVTWRGKKKKSKSPAGKNRTYNLPNTERGHFIFHIFSLSHARFMLIISSFHKDDIVCLTELLSFYSTQIISSIVTKNKIT